MFEATTSGSDPKGHELMEDSRKAEKAKAEEEEKSKITNHNGRRG